MAHAGPVDTLWLHYLSGSTELDAWRNTREPHLISATDARAAATECLGQTLASTAHGAAVHQIINQNVPKATLAYLRADHDDLLTQLRNLGVTGTRFATGFNTQMVRPLKGARQAQLGTGGWATHITTSLDDTPGDWALAAFAEKVDATAASIYVTPQTAVAADIRPPIPGRSAAPAEAALSVPQLKKQPAFKSIAMVVSGADLDHRDVITLSLICLELASPVKLSSLHKEIAAGASYDHPFCDRYSAARQLRAPTPGQRLRSFAQHVQQRFEATTGLSDTRYLTPPPQLDAAIESGNVALPIPPTAVDDLTTGRRPVLPRIDSRPVALFETYLLAELQEMAAIPSAAFTATTHLRDRLTLATALTERIENSLPVERHHFDLAPIAVSFNSSVVYPIALAISPHVIAEAWPSLAATCNQVHQLEQRVFGSGTARPSSDRWQPATPLGEYMVETYGLHGIAIREITERRMVF